MARAGVSGGLAAIVLMGYIASLVANFPGHFPPDALWQLAQGRAGRYNAWHPPITAWLLGIADRVHHGGWLFVVLNAGIFYGGLFAFVTLERRPRLISLALVLLWMISPVVLIYQGVVLKDVLFANVALGAFVALAWAGRCWTHTRNRSLLLAVSLLLFTLAELVRQNGFVVPIFGAGALAAIASSRPEVEKGRRVKQAAVWGVSALALVGVVGVLVDAALSTRSDGRPENANHLKVLQVYDLAGALRVEPNLSLPIVHAASPTLERFLREQAAPHYRPAGVDNLFRLPGGASMMVPRGHAVGQQWLDLIRLHPWLYVTTRMNVWLTTVGTPVSAACPMIITGVDSGDSVLLARAGLRARDDAKDEWDEDYASRFVGGPLYSHVFYGAVLFASLTWLGLRWRRGQQDPVSMATAGLGLAAVAFTASFFVASVDCDYRFLYFLDVAAMACASRVAAARPTAITEATR